MCGVAAYYGKGNAIWHVVNALKALSYRGYDSYGIAAITGKSLFEKKGLGDISALDEASFPSANICIGHTRWATHGKVTIENAHPIFSCNNKIAVVHNGEIENYLELKKRLSNHAFVSETDTETIPHLIEDFVQKGLSFREAFQKTLLQLRGKFAIVALNCGTGEMLVAKNAPPLVLGLKEKEVFVASDVTAFLKYTNKAIFLDDFEMVVVGEKAEVFDYRTMEKVSKNISLLEWKADEISKGFFKHFMLKEIFEQPAVIENLLKQHIKDNAIAFPEEIIRAIKNSERIVLVACGTAHYDCMIGAQLFETVLGKEARSDYASEFRYRNPIISKKDFVIAVSQSGETADTLAAIKLAKEKGAKVLSIINVKGSSIERASDFVLHIKAGAEIAVASTKAFSAAILLLSMLALKLNQEKGENIEKYVSELKKLPEKMRIVLSKHSEIKRISENFSKTSNALFLGRGLHYPIAMEGALKLKEISYIHAEGYPAAEMKHGPIALIDENMPVFFIALRDNVREKIISNIQEVLSRRGKVIIVCNEGDDEIKKMAGYSIEIPGTMEIFSPLLSLIPLQLFSYYIAEARGCRIDKPKNLAKSVTVE